MSDWEKRANHADGGRAKGGKLRLEGERLSFEPHGFDRAIDRLIDTPGGWSATLSEITEVGEEPRGKNPFDGSLRKRLRIVTADGQRQLFVVNGLDEAVQRLQAAVAANPVA